MSLCNTGASFTWWRIQKPRTEKILFCIPQQINYGWLMVPSLIVMLVIAFLLYSATTYTIMLQLFLDWEKLLPKKIENSGKNSIWASEINSMQDKNMMQQIKRDTMFISKCCLYMCNITNIFSVTETVFFRNTISSFVQFSWLLKMSWFFQWTHTLLVSYVHGQCVLWPHKNRYRTQLRIHGVLVSMSFFHSPIGVFTNIQHWQ